MIFYAALATAFLRGATASNVTWAGASTALCSWLGGACHANASECAAGAAFVSMKDICGGSGFGCCLGARATWAPTVAPAAGPPTEAPTNATYSPQKSCDRRFERGLRPLAKLYFDEACVVALELNKYKCPMNALNVILEEYIGGLRVEAFWLSFLSLVALICVIQLGGIPRPTKPKPKSESDESVDSPSSARTIESASSESGEPPGSPSPLGTIVWAAYLIAFILQLFAMLLSVSMMVCSYILMRREFRPCMKSFGDGAKILDVAALAAFFFIPPVLFRLAVIWVTMFSIGLTLVVYLATATEGGRYDVAKVDIFIMAMVALLLIVAACFLALYVLSGSVVFSIAFFLPLGLSMIILPVISYFALFCIRKLSEESKTPFGQGLARMLWWISMVQEWKTRDRTSIWDTSSDASSYLHAILYTVLLCPIIVFGILAAAYIYSGNSPSDNMHAIATMYEYAFQIFWVGKFTLPTWALDFHSVEDAFTYLAGFSDIEAFTVQEYFAGAHAFDTINFIISILKAVVAFIAAFVAWYSENLALKPNVDFDVLIRNAAPADIRKSLMEADSEQTKTGDADDEESPDVAVKRLDDKVVKRLDDKVDDVEERLGLLERSVWDIEVRFEDAEACVVS